MSIRGSFAEYGCDFYANTAAHTGSWLGFVCVNETVIDTILINNCTTEAALEDLTLPAGLVIYGVVTSITLTSGAVQMIRSPSLKSRD